MFDIILSSPYLTLVMITISKYIFMNINKSNKHNIMFRYTTKN